MGSPPDKAASDRETGQRCGVCVVIPTYNNAAVIGDVISDVLRHVNDVIVVDDGSTDGTAEAPAAFEGVTVVTHEANLGKGAALRSGFARAAEMGFTHAITVDGDGQHVADDLPAFLKAIGENLDALIVGVRDLGGGGRPLKSRLLRAHSNFWVWVETGKWVGDTQSGFRAYPLSPVDRLHLRCRRYDFEVEVLVRAVWTGVPVASVPVEVRYAPGSRSHFRPIRDFALVWRLNALLLAQRVFLPGRVRRVVQLKSSHEGRVVRHVLRAARDGVVSACGRPYRFAAAVGLGVACGILPIWGFQIAAAFVLAHRLKLNRGVAVAASNISFPAMIPVILYASLLIGRFALTGAVVMSPTDGGLTLSIVWRYTIPYLVGSVMLAAMAGLAAAAVAYGLALLLGRIVRRREVA